MTAGPLHPDNLPAGRDRSLGKGHGTDSLGPGDSSDSGADVKGAPDLAQQVGAAVPDGIDIDTDRIESVPDLEQIPDLDEEDDEGAPRRRRH